MPTGEVKFYNEERGYGFIIRDDREPDIFVHVRSIVSSTGKLAAGQRVEFETGEGRGGKLAAEKVRVI